MSTSNNTNNKLEDFLNLFFELPYPNYNMGLLPDEEGYDVLQQNRNYEESEAREIAKEELESLIQQEIREVTKERDAVWTKRDEYWKWYLIEHARDFPQKTLKQFVKEQFTVMPSEELQKITEDKSDTTRET